jgi:hypothetical protein
MKSTIGENAVAITIAGATAAIAAIAGFVGGVFLCGLLFKGEATESGLVVAPALALVLGVAAFVFTFSKIASYGEPKDH